MKELLSGNEAIARGIYEAGIRICSAYPGTPSTEILENAAKYQPEVYCEWAPNEKVAAEVAYGAAVAGSRSLCAMKMVGLNVAADPLFTAGYMGANAAYVLVTADDPSMHSSQNEQDNRYYARAAKVAMVEPSDSQECKDFVRAACEISERFDTPVLFRTTTRVNHSKSLVTLGEREEVPPRPYQRNVRKYVCSPANAYRNHPAVEERLRALEEYADTCPLNRMELRGKKIGVVTASVAYQYAREAFPEDASFLKLGLTYPLPMALIRRFASQVETLYVVEELEPFMETEIRAAGIPCRGKELTGKLYELNAQLLRERIFGIRPETKSVPAEAVSRPPRAVPRLPAPRLFSTRCPKTRISSSPATSAAIPWAAPRP
jgi:indolepyruvate ferredoxin oxidoreductase alpha subunit